MVPGRCGVRGSVELDSATPQDQSHRSCGVLCFSTFTQAKNCASESVDSELGSSEEASLSSAKGSVDPSGITNDLCGCVAFPLNAKTAFGASRLHNSAVEDRTVCRAFFGRQFTTAADEGCRCGASLWNWTAFKGSPLLPSGQDAGIPYSNGIESSLEKCSVSLHLCMEYSTGIRLLLWPTSCFAS